MANCPTCGFRLPWAEGRCPRCAVNAKENGHAVRATERPRAPDADGGVEPDTAPDLISALEFDESRAEPVTRPASAAGGGALDVHIRVRTEYSAVPRDLDPVVRVLVDLTPEGPPALDPRRGPVAHVVLVLDLSASMNHADKYPVLTEALTGMLCDLARPGAAEVLLSVVVFAWGAEILFRDVPASTLAPRDVLAKIDGSRLRFGRYTDVAGGLKHAGRIACAQLGVNRAMPIRVCLLTDGRPQDEERTRRMVAMLARLPVDVDALAFGADADVAFLQELVSGGRGGTVKQVRPETLGDAFDRIAEVAQRVVANRAVVEFELAGGVAGGTAYRYRPGRHRFADGAFAGGSTFSADLGTLESGRVYSLLFEVRVPESESDMTQIGRLTLRVPGYGGARVFTADVAVPRTMSPELPEPDADVSATHDVLAATDDSDPGTQLRALRVRRKLYVAERRDPHVIAIIEKAISALEEEGSLAALSVSERATLRSHTCTAGGSRTRATPREFAGG